MFSGTLHPPLYTSWARVHPPFYSNISTTFSVSSRFMLFCLKRDYFSLFWRLMFNSYSYMLSATCADLSAAVNVRPTPLLDELGLAYSLLSDTVPRHLLLMSLTPLSTISYFLTISSKLFGPLFGSVQLCSPLLHAACALLMSSIFP